MQNTGGRFSVGPVLVLEIIEFVEGIDLLFVGFGEELLELFVLLLELEDVVSDGTGVHVGRH
jgi:hypothetical protein